MNGSPDGLSKAQQDSILDFYFRCGDDESIAAGRDLIASNPEAARLYTGLEETLTALDPLKYEPCPDNLVELTIGRLKAAAAGQSRLQALLADQQRLERERATAAGKQHLGQRWRAPLRLVAMAAGFLVVVGIGVPALRNIRYAAWQAICQSHLGRLAGAMSQYAADYDGALPYEPLAAGTPWWKVGYQGPDNQSATRPYFKLIGLGYAEGRDFTCPGQPDGRVLALSRNQSLNDFPSRRYVSFSFPLRCDNTCMQIEDKTIVATDRNPLFADLPCEPPDDQRDEFGRIVVTEQLERMLSLNHRNRGQNVLWTDGSVQFLRQRTVTGDDIFTVAVRTVYMGTEAPCSSSDLFFVP